MDRPAPATPDQIAAYCARIGFEGAPRPDLATLTELHRRHVEAIPWENFDVLLGRPVTRDPGAAFEKIVGAGRGGWCYEMNGLFQWMLECVGFRLTRLATGVMREQLGDSVVGNHLMALVDLDGGRWVADVGLGGGLLEPIPLEEGDYRQRFLTYRLRRLEDGWWRFSNQPGVPPPSFDFHPEVTDEALLEERCTWLQTDPGSPFTKSALVQRHSPEGLHIGAGPVAVRMDDGPPLPERAQDGAAFVRRLKETFGLDLPQVEALWPQISSAATPFD